MTSPHEIDPRAFDDPRNVYPTDEQFYAHGRPAVPLLPEDRPRGGRPASPLHHRGTWATVALVAGIILLILVGIALFP
ncbi:hypothetical protein OHB41_20495 [Streptomyces sp. NBC_01571]|uniref:hypothetical protein n=1 Tax=Streptomyces sp. NBC_01571 TaxID=2975883 RepID=UPI0022582735|nr:hypothetical protein [Streptomyces sp. NBC_01571]MCX4575527.1 hypothetical protein [Streptomyces sp. NBC_01571]